MKHFIILTIIFLFSNSAFCQQDEFWGTTSAGGNGDAGVIFSLKTDGTGYAVRHNFLVDKPGINPIYAPLLLNNIYYGVTESGGRYAGGVLYSYNKTTQVYTVLNEFKIEFGYRPYTNVVAVNGKLYGTTYSCNGGNSKPGVIYEYDLATNVYSVKKIFSNYTGSVLGANPSGSLMVYNNKIYGSTQEGGSGLAGSIFEYDPATNGFRSLYGFGYLAGAYPNGKQPNGSLCLYNDELYGTAGNGGSNNAGVIFKYNLTTNTFSKVADFGGAGNGSGPGDGMLLVGGIFYGTTGNGGTSGGGTLYSFNPVNNNITYLQQFSYTGPVGGGPGYKLTYFNNLFYGFATKSISNTVNIFSYNPITNILSSEYSSSEVESFRGDFLVDNNKFITVSLFEGNGMRMISFDPATKIKSTIFNFNTFPLGASPNQSLLYDNNIFYGSTTTGGTNGLGVVFSFNPLSNTYTVLYNLTTNAYQLGDFVRMGSKLYAPATRGWTTSSSQNFGAVFYIDPVTNAASLTPSGSSASSPTGVMVPTSFPNELYVLTSESPGNVGGALTRFNTSTNTFFGAPTSYYSSGTFPVYTSKTSDGRIFVSTQYSGTNNQGSLHLNSVGTKTSFQSSTTGRGPDGAIAELNGKYYITTRFDGPVNGNTGTMVEIDPANMNTPTYKLSFARVGGTNHRGNLITNNNSLFGVMYSGGVVYINSSGEQVFFDRGSIFQYNTLTNVYTKLYDFNGAEGTNPTSLIKAPTAVVPVPLRFISFTAKICRNMQVCVNWQTANESNVSHFEIERSTDGNKFTKIGRAVAQNQSANTYNASDNLTSLSNYTRLFYRIKQIDTDGKFTHTKIEVVNINEEVVPGIYPNPVNDFLVITEPKAIKNIVLTGMPGNRLKRWTANFSVLDVKDVPAGIYVVEITLKSGKMVRQKIVKL